MPRRARLALSWRRSRVAPFCMFSMGTKLVNGEVVSTADGDSVTCNGQSSDSSSLTGDLDARWIYFDAQAEKDTTVTIRNTFHSSRLPGASGKNRAAKLVMQSSVASGGSVATFTQQVCEARRIADLGLKVDASPIWRGIDRGSNSRRC